MITLIVTYHCKPAMREVFLGRIIADGIDAACRSEDGNIRYDYFVPADGSSDLLLVEKWRDEKALAAHGTQPHMAKLKALKAEYVTDTVIERFVPQA